MKPKRKIFKDFPATVSDDLFTRPMIFSLLPTSVFINFVCAGISFVAFARVKNLLFARHSENFLRSLPLPELFMERLLELFFNQNNSIPRKCKSLSSAWINRDDRVVDKSGNKKMKLSLVFISRCVCALRWSEVSGRMLLICRMSEMRLPRRNVFVCGSKIFTITKRSVALLEQSIILN